MPELTIAGHVFEVPHRYQEGHTLNANEAAALNQTFHENIRNNVAAKIKKATPEGGTHEWTDEAIAHWTAEVARHANEYQFGVRTGGGRGPAMDPETRFAIEEAEAAIVMGLKQANQQAPKGKALRDLAKQVLDGPQGDRFRQLAKRRLKAAQDSANLVIEGLLKPAA